MSQTLLILGLGGVGCFAAHLAARLPGLHVVVGDVCEAHARQVANSLISVNFFERAAQRFPKVDAVGVDMLHPEEIVRVLETWQPDIIFFPFLLVWLNDTFAYLCGSAFGKHKLFPRISPKKSWEGSVGGGIITIGAGLAIAPYIDGITIVDAGVISAIVVVFGSFGDLVESMFKRCIEVKDSGHIMPGHGGVFDRLDSILFALPAIFVYLAFAV